MSTLRLLDASQYISAGAHTKSNQYFLCGDLKMIDGRFEENTMPTSGVVYLLEAISEMLNEEDCDVVVCFDDKPTIKRGIFEEKLLPIGYGRYKGNRPPKPIDIEPQRELAYEIVKHIGLNAVKVKGVEADDCIASIVKYYKDSYSKVVIHTKDSDLYYLVDNTVEVQPLNRYGKSGKYVNRANWENTVNNDYVVNYNMLTLLKMEQGEHGDNIPRVNKTVMQNIYNCIPKDMYPKLGDNELLRKFVELGSGNCPTTMAIFDLITPIIVDQSDVELFDQDLDKQLFNYYLSRVKCGASISSISFEKAEATLERFLDDYNGR